MLQQFRFLEPCPDEVHVSLDGEALLYHEEYAGKYSKAGSPNDQGQPQWVMGNHTIWFMDGDWSIFKFDSLDFGLTTSNKTLSCPTSEGTIWTYWEQGGWIETGNEVKVYFSVVGSFFLLLGESIYLFWVTPNVQLQ